MDEEPRPGPHKIEVNTIQLEANVQVYWLHSRVVVVMRWGGVGRGELTRVWVKGYCQEVEILPLKTLPCRTAPSILRPCLGQETKYTLS